MFDSLTIEVVWAKGSPIPGCDPRQWRSDKFGYTMQRSAYGTCGIYGWEVDHLVPVSQGGTDIVANLRPLHWACNRRKSDKLSLADFLTG